MQYDLKKLSPDLIVELTFHGKESTKVKLTKSIEKVVVEPGEVVEATVANAKYLLGAYPTLWSFKGDAPVPAPTKPAPAPTPTAPAPEAPEAPAAGDDGEADEEGEE